VFVQGDNAQTGNPLDLSIQGDGFFQVTMPDGTLAYTRAGSMKLDNTGAIVTSDGLRMNPAITIPSNAISISVDSVGTVAVTQQGTAAPVTLGTIQLATFQNPAGLQAIGQNLYKESGSSGTPLTANPGTGNAGTILQGSLELSNVSVVEEMVNLITAQRAYEVNSKSVQTADQMLQVSNNLVR
jgi:flagellar basal-body rod protein FlgG